ncbi:MAG: hypothetical protein MZW92_14190 [Comamonadaceae bacterium]|nr:hypothetical protein [Comamonadaceae bacterium]
MTFHDGARAMQPKDTTTNEGLQGLHEQRLPVLPLPARASSASSSRLFCYCPLSALECPGNYQVFVSANGVTRK